MDNPMEEKSTEDQATPGLIDTHAHIYVERYDDDFDAMLDRARENGVERIIMPATKPSEYTRVLDLAERYPQLHAAIGVHPHHAAEVDERDLETVERVNSEGMTVAVGEIGLDYYYDLAPRDR